MRSAREVLTETDQLVSQDRKLTLRLLENLHEIESNKFYLEIGYGSMFEYCTGHLKCPEGTAVRRIRTARCLAAYPQLRDLLVSGEVNPSTVSAISKLIKPDNAETVIEAIKNKSAREVALFVATLQPLTAVPPARIRPFVVAVPHCAKSTTNVGGKDPSTIENVTLTVSDSDKLPAPPPAQHEVSLEFKRMLHVELNIPEERVRKLDRIRALASHRLRSSASLDEVIDFMADYFLEREDPVARDKRREERARNMAQNQTGNGREKTTASFSNPRYIAAAVKDKVCVRDRQQCTYVSPDGKQCGSTHIVQVDHVTPVARNGGATMDNLRLLCGPHNRMEAERLMGVRRRK